MNKKDEAESGKKSNSGGKILHLNPYIAGNPVADPKGFFGREDVFRDVKRMLRNPHDNAIVLYGQRRIGKTSVLLQLKHRLKEEGEYTPVYFDLQDKSAKTLGEVLRQLAHEIASVTGQTMPEMSLFDENGEYFRKVFLPEAADRSATGGLVLLFDEFDVLERPQETPGNQAGQIFFPYLRSCMVELQRVKFYFVIGRRPEDLSQDASSFFKGARSSRISTLNKKDGEDIVRQSERDGSLFWSDAAVEKVWDWTQGHTYMTQLLCSVVWERAYDQEPTTAPRAKPADIDAAIDETLKQGQNAFHWIWDGLPPAERVVMAAMAEAGDAIITQEKLREILNRCGVRLILSELELAPETLVKWELLREAEGGYCFAVALLRSWVTANRPLRRVKDELDRIDKRADMLFRTAEIFHSSGNVAEAENLLRKALESNRNHLKAMQLLGNILFDSDRIIEAVDVLQQAYDYDQTAAQGYLIKALLVLAERQTIGSEQLATYERVLKIDSNQRIAQGGLQKIWIARGEEYLKEELFDQAIAAFEEANEKTKAKLARESKHLHEFNDHSNTLALHKKNKNWIAAKEILNILISDFSDQGDFRKELEFVESQASLGQRYHDALLALEQDDNETARGLLVGIISQEPDYMEAPRHLIRVLYGKDVDIARDSKYKKVLKMRGVKEHELQPAKPSIIFKTQEKVLPQPKKIEEPGKAVPNEIAIDEKPPRKKLFEQFKPVVDFIRRLVGKLSFLWQKLISSEPWKKLFKNPFSWLASSFIWLPLIIGAAIGSDTPLKSLINSKLALAIIFFAALLITALVGHLGKMPKKEIFFKIGGQQKTIPAWVILIAALLIVAIVALMIGDKKSLVLWLVLLGALLASASAWKRIGSATVLVACGVVLFTALSLPNPEAENIIQNSQSTTKPITKTDSPDTSRRTAKSPSKAIVVTPTIGQLADSLVTLILNGSKVGIFEITQILNDSLDHKKSATKKNFQSRFDVQFYSKAIDLLNAKEEKSAIALANLLAKLQDIKTLVPIFEKFSVIKPYGKERCLLVIEGFSTTTDKQAKLRIAQFLSEQRGKQGSTQLDQAIERLVLKFPIEELPPPTPTVPELVEKLEKVLKAGSYAEVIPIANVLNDSLVNETIRQKYENSFSTMFDDDFYSKVFDLFEKGNDQECASIIKLLNKLQLAKSRMVIYKSFSSNSQKVKLRSLEVLDGFTKAEWSVRREIKTWLGVTGPFETGEANTAIQKSFRNFKAAKVPKRAEMMVWINNLKLPIKSDKISIGIADSILGLAEVDTLRFLKSDDIFDKKFYEKALEFLKNNNKYISRSMTLFLSKLQTANGDLRKQVENFWEKNNSIEVRPLCMVIFAGIAQNSKEKDKVIGFMKRNRTPELTPAIDQIISNIEQERK